MYHKHLTYKTGDIQLTMFRQNTVVRHQNSSTTTLC